VLSQRNAQKEYREKQKTRLLSDLAEGQVRTGTVTGLRDFGAFVDLGGADGLIHISELSWRRVKHPSEVLAVGQEVEVEVLKVDRESKRIGLSLKRRQPDPWQRVGERFQPGQVVEGTLTRLAPFGAFVDLGEGVEGLLPTNQIANQPGVIEGAQVRVRILNVEPERQRIGLALQQLLSEMASDEEADSPLPPEPDEPEAGEIVSAEDEGDASMERRAPTEAPEEEDEA
jgi:small subunit ribosomal protein S1